MSRNRRHNYILEELLSYDGIFISSIVDKDYIEKLPREDRREIIMNFPFIVNEHRWLSKYVSFDFAIKHPSIDWNFSIIKDTPVEFLLDNAGRYIIYIHDLSDKISFELYKKYKSKVNFTAYKIASNINIPIEYIIKNGIHGRSDFKWWPIVQERPDMTLDTLVNNQHIDWNIPKFLKRKDLKPFDINTLRLLKHYPFILKHLTNDDITNNTTYLWNNGKNANEFGEDVLIEIRTLLLINLRLQLPNEIIHMICEYIVKV